jgi:hypothetical protein
MAEKPPRMSVTLLINRRARRGSQKIAKLAANLLPHARVVVTHSFEDVERWLSGPHAPGPNDVVLAGGGDGTTVGLLNAFRRAKLPFPIVGVLPLGTGNAWARTTHAPPAPLALSLFSRWEGAVPPTRHFALVDTEGQLAHFAGTGWDAELISDYHAWLALHPAGIGRKLTGGLIGYLAGLFTMTIPRHLGRAGPVQMELVNLSDEDALTADESGNIVPVPNSGKNKVLYRGPASVAAAATTPEWGFGFKAFPFADKVKDRLSIRVYGGKVLEATRRMLPLWRGVHPIPKMYDFFVTHGRMRFDQEVPFQVAGDLAGMKREFEFKIDSSGVRLIDWSRLTTEPSLAPQRTHPPPKTPSPEAL